MSEGKKVKVVKPLIKNVAFFGDANVEESTEEYRDAYEVAKILAREGFTIVNGGGPGIMNASTQGAEVVGGETIAVTFLPKDAPGFEGRYVGNITDKVIRTKNYIERMFKLMEHADLYLIFKGGTGTISEFGTAWVLSKLYYGHHKPFILFGGFWRPVVQTLQENLNIDRAEMSVFKIVDRQEEVLPAIREFEEEMAKVDHSHCEVCSERAFMT